MNSHKTAIVTGGERGIGRAIVETLQDQGYAVAVLGLDLPAAATLPPTTQFLQCDVSDFQSVSEATQRICESWGQLDALVCNAGIASPERSPIETLDPAVWQRVLDVNLNGPFFCAKAATRFLKKANGAIVNIASTRAHQSEANTFSYSASKGGLVALTHSLAISLGPEIRANSVSPGWILNDPNETTTSADQQQHPAGRVGVPQDIAELVAYLVDKKSGFVTGQDFIVDGGISKKMIYV